MATLEVFSMKKYHTPSISVVPYNKEKKIYDNDVRVRGLRSTAPFLLFKAGVQCQERWVSCFFSFTYRRCEFGSIELNKYILCSNRLIRLRVLKGIGDIYFRIKIAVHGFLLQVLVCFEESLPDLTFPGSSISN